MVCTGQGWEQIRNEWDIPRLVAWNNYTADHPPLHIMVAAYLDIKPSSRPKHNPDELITELSSVPFAAQTSAPARPIRKDLMPWLKKT